MIKDEPYACDLSSECSVGLVRQPMLSTTATWAGGAQVSALAGSACSCSGDSVEGRLWAGSSTIAAYVSAGTVPAAAVAADLFVSTHGVRMIDLLRRCCC